MTAGLPGDYEWFRQRPQRLLRVRHPTTAERIFSAPDASVCPHDFRNFGLVVCTSVQNEVSRTPILPHADDRWLRIIPFEPDDTYAKQVLLRGTKLDVTGYLFFTMDRSWKRPVPSDQLANVRADVDSLRRTLALLIGHVQLARDCGVTERDLQAELMRAGPSITITETTP